MVDPANPDVPPLSTVAGGLLLRDPSRRILLVRPSYKDGWDIPGGIAERGESPRECCRREIVEELGMPLAVGRLLVVDFFLLPGAASGSFRFVYDGGILEPQIAASIRLDPTELVEWRFVDVGTLDLFVSDPKARRLRAAHGCALAGGLMELEWGFPAQVDQPPADAW